MNKIILTCAGGIVGMLVSVSVSAHNGYGMDAAEYQDMMHQMKSLQQQSMSMHDASPAERGPLMRRHNNGMHRMMTMMRNMSAHHGEHEEAGAGEAGHMSPEAMDRRMDMLEEMMSQLVDHMEMTDRSAMHK